MATVILLHTTTKNAISAHKIILLIKPVFFYLVFHVQHKYFLFAITSLQSIGLIYVI